MKTLILNVDRDDDFGRKAKIKSPIVGIKDNNEAANKLGQADPEDSDLNAIFAAISIYNTYIKDKKDAEIATICGDIKVGIKSDEIITKQLEEVIKVTNADNVILVTDGAEDEYVLPIIQSRIKITSINRVSVKQSKELEDTYFRLLKILEDEKVKKQFLLPIALVFIVWSFFILLGMIASGFGAMLLVLGFYLLIRVFRWERKLIEMWEETKKGLIAGKISIYTSILALVVLIAFCFLSYNSTFVGNYFPPDAPLIPALLFISNIVWGIVIAGLIAVLGLALDMYIRERKAPWNYYMAPFSIFAFGFISSAVFNSLYYAFKYWPSKFDVDVFLTLDFIGYTITGILIAVVGAITHHYIKDMYITKEKKLEIEEQTIKLVEKN